MTTMAIVLITVYVLGGTTELALKIFRIDTGVDEHTYMRDTLRERECTTWSCVGGLDSLLNLRTFLVFFFLSDCVKQNKELRWVQIVYLLLSPLASSLMNMLSLLARCRTESYQKACYSRVSRR